MIVVKQDILENPELKRLMNPAIILVGEVVRLREKIQWWESSQEIVMKN